MREIRRSVPTPLGIPAEIGPDTLTGLNNKGQVIGCTSGLDGVFAPFSGNIQYEEHSGNNTVGWGENRAILWQDGKAYNLNDLIPKEAGWVWNVP